MGVAHMDDGGRRCALPGCDRTITTTAGRPERRYCTAAHRAAARRARRAAAQPEQPDGPDALAEALPWLRDAIGTGAARRTDVGDPGDSGEPDAEPPADVTPAAPATEASSRSRDRRPMPRRRHALALLGVAGILAGGYAVTDAQPAPAPVRAAPEGEAVPDGAVADTWAQRATVALASVNRQLDTLAQTEQEWQRLPGSGRAVVPAPVAALAERRSVLQRRRATLQAQLDDYRSLRRTQQELGTSEQHLRAVETALADAPPRRRRTAEQEAAIAALEEQRDLRIRRRDVQRTELASLQDGVSTATRTPLPDDGAATAKVTDDVLEMVHNGGTEPARPDPKPPRPEVVAGREAEDGKPRQEVGTSGPPDPRGPRDESDERRAAKKKRAAGARDGDAKAAGDARKADEPTPPSRGKRDDAAQRGDVGAHQRGTDDRAARKDPTERRSAGDEADTEKHAQVGHLPEKPRDDRTSAEKHSAAGVDPGSERSAGKPVQRSAVEDTEKGHGRGKDRESPDRNAAESRAHYRQAGMRPSTERKSVGTDATGSQAERASKDGDLQERDARERDARQHHGVKKRESADRRSEGRDSQGRDKDRDKDRDSTGRDAKGHESKGHGSTEHGSTQHESEQGKSGDHSARHRHDPDSERNHRADPDDDRDDGPHRAARSADR